MKIRFITADQVSIPRIVVNRRNVYIRRITEFREVKRGFYEGVANGRKFNIEGGKAAGGTARDWFLDWEGILHGLHCTSLVDALETLENC